MWREALSRAADDNRLVRKAASCLIGDEQGDLHKEIFTFSKYC